MRNIVTTINSIITLIPNTRVTYDLIQELTTIRDKAATSAPEVVIDSWRELNDSLLKTFKPEQFELQSWEQQIITILTTVE